MKHLLAVLTAALFSSVASANAVDQRFPDDFFQSKPLTDAAMAEVPDGIKLLLSAFLLRVRWCQAEEKKWIHRGLTIKEAILLEKKLQENEGPFDPKNPKLKCPQR